jgi:hypothetical protein
MLCASWMMKRAFHQEWMKKLLNGIEDSWRDWLTELNQLMKIINNTMKGIKQRGTFRIKDY